MSSQDQTPEPNKSVDPIKPPTIPTVDTAKAGSSATSGGAATTKSTTTANAAKTDLSILLGDEPTKESELSKTSGQNLTPPWYRRRRTFIIAAAALVVLIGGGFGVYKLAHRSDKPVAARTPTPKPTPSATPAPPTSPLTGLPVASAAAASQPVVGVMIENLYPDARPQSGLGEAGIVYEALAEGGITRFLAIFQEPLPSSIGPVRSLRPYYLDWGLEYNIPVAHAGGSQPALAEVKPLGLKDINALIYDGSYFYRTSDRVAPHNLYTNATLLSQIVAKLGFATAPTFTPPPRKADAPVASPAHPSITINFSSAAYVAKYTFDPKSDAYARDDGGTPHIDRLTGAQIEVKNIVVEFVPTTYGTQDDGKPETNYNLIGSGKALVFENGDVTTATWSKATDPAPTKLTDAGGKPISFNKGNTWYEVVPTGSSVTY